MNLKRKTKVAPQDFTENMLPVNRKEMFFDCIKQRFDIIVKCGIIMALSSLLFYIVKIWGDLAFINLNSNYTETDATEIAKSMQLIISLAEIPGYALIGIGVAAVSRIMRQLIWSEPVFFFYHAKLGFKQNGAQFLLLFLLFGILNTISTFVLSLLDNMIFSFLPMAITLFFFVPIGLYMLSQYVFYKVGFARSFLNGMTIFYKTAPYTWIFAIVLYVPLLITLIPSIIIRIFVHAVIIIFATPVFIISWLLYSSYIFDKHINQKLYPEIVGKGLYKPTFHK